MNTDEKRQWLVDALKDAMEKDPLIITFKSPPVRNVFYFKDEVDKLTMEDLFGPDEFPYSEDSSMDMNFDYDDYDPSEDPYEEISDEPIYDARKLKKKRKEKQREQKAFERIRKDAHKRGYDTSVLVRLEEPEDLYSLSDDEIDQIRAAGFVNEDGFYNFVYPDDVGDIKKFHFSKKRILLLSAVIVTFFILVVILVNNVMNLF